MKNRIALCVLLLYSAISMYAQTEVSLIATSMKYSVFDSGSNRWSEWDGEEGLLVPISINPKEGITISVEPITKLRISKIDPEQKTKDGVGRIYHCSNDRGTRFDVSVTSAPNKVTMNVINSQVKMTYFCRIAKPQPHYETVDLGLSCKWGIANYYNYRTDIVSAVYHGGSRLQYRDAMKQFGGNGTLRLPTKREVEELLKQCSWQFIDNPDHDFKKGFLVTGPNGKQIFFPCESGSDGSYSYATYLTSTSYDEYLVNTLQLNAQSRVLHPTDKLESLYVRLVEDK